MTRLEVTLAHHKSRYGRVLGRGGRAIAAASLLPPLGLVAASLYLIQLWNSAPPQLEGRWRIELVEHAPPLIAPMWPARATLRISEEGAITHHHEDTQQEPDAFAVIVRDACLQPCYTATSLSLDYRVPNPVNFRVKVVNPSWVELFGAGGMRIVLVRAG